MTRKQKYRAQIQAWRSALADGRVLRHAAAPNVLKSFPTTAARDAAMRVDPLYSIVHP